MTVSIVIPAYNHDRFVAVAIESALQQSWPQCEVVVVDDGSTDDSPTVFARYPQICTVWQPNRGLAAARNAGLKASRGDIVVFLDADDRLWPDAAKHAVELLKARPDAAMAFGRCRLVNELGVPLPTNLPEVHADFYDELLRDNYIWTPAMAAFRRSVFDVVGVFNEGISAAADYDLYLRITRQFPVVSHNAITVDYRQHGDNMSRDAVLMLTATLSALRAQQPHIISDPQRTARYRDAIARWRTIYGERLVDRFRGSLHARHYGAALSSAWHLLRLYPAGVRSHLFKKARLTYGRLAGRPDKADPRDSAVDMSRL